uniref:A-kinase interacting protein 1 n=1 Tax=Capra hircus TaxID=9925 RepID=A0A452EL13_CAPHI
MENCLVAAALNGVDRRSLQRSARLGQEVLERAKRRAVDWPSVELPKGSVGIVSRVRHYGERGPAASPQRLLPGKREDRHPTLSASFRTMAEYMNYTSSQCGPKHAPDLPKYYSSAPEEGGATHVYRYHRGTSELHLCSDAGSGRVCILSCAVPSAENISKDLYIEVYPGTYSVTVGADDLTKKTHVVAVDSGQSVDLVFPI